MINILRAIMKTADSMPEYMGKCSKDENSLVLSFSFIFQFYLLAKIQREARVHKKKNRISKNSWVISKYLTYI